MEMRINNPFAIPLPSTAKEEKKNPGGVNFGELLQDALEKVNLSQLEAEAVSSKLIAGEIEDLHQVMIAVEKAGLSLQLTVQVTNKIIEAYKEITRMQV
jgi:flagellar hook-basal body complex protein FliE